jgi:hypothetical protein
MRRGEDEKAALAALMEGSQAVGFTPINADEPESQATD